MDELNGERIDIISWSKDPVEYIKTALAPAKVAHIQLDEKVRRARVYVNPDQRPLAIGKEGQNVRLASKLTDYELDIMDIGELNADARAADEAKAKIIDLSALEGVTPETTEKLAKANLTQIEQVRGLSIKDLVSIEGVTEEEANIIIDAIKKLG